MYERERALLPHYASRLDYYSPADAAGLATIMGHVPGLPESGHVLDLGCGDGRAASWAIHKGFTYTGVDFCPERIEKARTNFAAPGVRLVCNDVYDQLDQVGSGSIDVALAFEVLEHLENPQRIVRGLRRVLKPGGLGVGTVPVNMPYVAHLHVFATEDVVRVLLDPNQCFRIRARRREHFVLVWKADKSAI